MSSGQRIRSGWRSAPIAIFGLAILVLLGGVGVIYQSNATYAHSRMDQTQGFADILAASSAAAVDFNDVAAAQQSADAYRVNPQIRMIGIYDRFGKRLAGYQRSGGTVPATIETIPLPTSAEMRVKSPITQSGQVIGTVYLDVDKDQRFRIVARYLILFGMFLLVALIVASLGLAQGRLRKANSELADRAEALAQSNTLLEEQMEERAKAEEELRQSQKMQALGQLTGGIAHDFNNLLTVIQGSADMLSRPELPEPKRMRFAQAIVQAATNAASLTSQLLAFARRQPLKPEKIDVNELLEETRELIQSTIDERIELCFDLHPRGCRIEVDRAQLQSAFLNIASNARDAMPDGGRLTVGTAVEPGDAERPAMIAISLADTGTGMDAATADRIFEPFFTTKSTGKGTGLGLSQVYGFASQSGGEVRVDSAPGRGTSLTLLLPCVESEGAATAARSAGSFAALPPSAILVVEDNEDVGAFAEILLAELGHSVTRAATGEEALEIARARKFDVVLSDVVMPGMGGLRFAEILAREQPGLPVVLATGYSQEITQTGSGGRPVILKPYRLATLSEALASAMRK